MSRRPNSAAGIHFRRLRLAQIVTQCGPHQNLGRVCWQLRRNLRSLVHNKPGMQKDIAFGMPNGILRHARERCNWREDRELPHFMEALKSVPRILRERQNPPQLPSNPLDRHAGQILRCAERHQFIVHASTKLRRKPRYAQNTEWIFRESGSIGGSQNTALQILPAG